MTLPEIIKEQRRSIVEQIVSDIQTKGFEWQQGWSDFFSPTNATTNKPYRGGNRLHLAYIARNRGFDDPRWCTFHQAKEAGWHIKRGAKSAKVEKWKMVGTQSEDEDGELTFESFPVCVGTWSVFNACEIEGIPARESENAAHDDEELASIADGLIASSRCPVHEKASDGAYYQPRIDVVTLPKRNAFTSMQGFIRTLLHEMSHATGHPSALNRPLCGRFGTPEYAFEELIAELSSGFAAAETGLNFESESVDPAFYESHCAYLQSWIAALQNDPNELFRAASQADKAADFIIARYRSQVTGEKAPQVA